MAQTHTKTLKATGVVDTADGLACAYTFPLHNPDGYIALDAIHLHPMEQLRHTPMVASAIFLNAKGAWCLGDITPVLGQLDAALFETTPMVLATREAASIGHHHLHSGSEGPAPLPRYTEFPLRTVPHKLLAAGKGGRGKQRRSELVPSLRSPGGAKGAYEFAAPTDAGETEQVVLWYTLLSLVTSRYFGATVILVRPSPMGMPARRNVSAGEAMFSSGAKNADPMDEARRRQSRVVELHVARHAGVEDDEGVVEVARIVMSTALHTAITSQLNTIVKDRTDWVTLPAGEVAEEMHIEGVVETVGDDDHTVTRFPDMPVCANDADSDGCETLVGSTIAGHPPSPDDAAYNHTMDVLWLDDRDGAEAAPVVETGLARSGLDAHPYCCCDGTLVITCTQPTRHGAKTRKLRQYPDHALPTIELVYQNVQ